MTIFISELKLFYQLQTRLWHNQLCTWKQHSFLKIGVVTTFALLFFLSIFLFFYAGFSFFQRNIAVDFYNLIVENIFAIFFFILFVMLIFSSGVVGLSVLFHAQETHFLMTCPLTHAGTFFYKFFETFLVSSWAVLFLGIPICCAYGIQQGVSWEYYPLLIVAFIPFILLASLVGTFATFVIVLQIKKYIHWIAWGFFCAFIASVIFLVISIIQLREEASVMSATWLFSLLDSFSFAQHPLSPSTWTYKAILELSHQEYRHYAFHVGVMLSNVLLLGLLCYWMASFRYAQAWDIIHSTKQLRKVWSLTWLRKFLRIFVFLTPQDRTFLEKDIKIFIRDPLQWSQFAILIGLLFLYVLNLRTLQYDQRVLFWKHFITTLNLAATSMILCTFSSRFIFPMISLEGKRFWILGVLPLERRNILIAKFLFAVVLLVLVSQTLVILSCYMLRLPLSLTILHSFTTLEIALGVSGLAVGLGSLYPNFKEDSPAKIVSGFGGTLNLVLGLVYVGIMVTIQNLPSYYILRGSQSLYSIYIWIIIGFFLTICTCVLPLYLGIRTFSKLEL